VFEEVKTEKKKVLITKRGGPIAEVVPVDTQEKGVFLKAAMTVAKSKRS
jgi:prevent-host-death family protein